MKHKQAGLSLIGLLIVAVLLAFVFLIGMRTVPVVTEYFAVKKIIHAIAASNPSMDETTADIRRDFDKRASAEYVDSVTGQDLAVYKHGGQFEIGIEYSRKIPIVANVSLLLEFQTDAKSNGGR
ncbi:DUF4845 domain-containing protein [Nitrogeniibacter mangrovi]|uniref:DUF4845 domain-containing protein n=1 Tax=Nitrogeniibacter mangrovi TaxID=2016596 RepID=A0A6C1B2A0_9RHOO|nr:DUF4845 domain-containing protein [Nitrogeniibacter mangrovi]QID17771.1 DUF4845 domain-containing protein [Nitrogeniibacter mangrovi]